MNQANAGARTNYTVETAVGTGKKKKYKVVGTVTANYVSATNTVTLTVTGNQPFTSGGMILINTAGASGVQSASGVSLDASDAILSIGTKAKTLTVG
jgi:hypothetical protein